MEANRPNEAQSALWNGPSGRAWVDAQAPLDRMFEPFETLLAEAAAASFATRVLDVGCGTGAVTLAIARRLGASAQCTGIDISARMIDAARARAERGGVPARFVCADVQTHAFEPASVDLIVSRLGVMFFDDPVRAFANLRQ
ncbi:class I SAM-dependent methyltransferase, partial [Burkholderia cenocepacia]